MDNVDNKIGKKHINKYLNRNQKLVIFWILSVFIIYTLANVFFNSDTLSGYLLSGLIFILFIIGIIFISAQITSSNNYKISIKDFDLIFAALGVVVTYELTFLFSVSTVITSAGVGILGYFLFKKHAMAIYCGSFAGMTSSQILNHYEIIVLALICAVVYLFVKTIFDGYGGRLGTIAFVSTTITVLIFNKTELPTFETFNIWVIIVFSIMGVIIPYLIQHKLNQSSIISSAVPSLVIGLVSLIFPSMLIYSGVFFTASFVGMSSKNVIPNFYSGLFIGLILSIIFFTFFNFYNGFGGKMGLSALISVIIYVGINKFFEKFIKPLLIMNKLS
jgi:hypothetical protein